MHRYDPCHQVNVARSRAQHKRSKKKKSSTTYRGCGEIRGPFRGVTVPDSGACTVAGQGSVVTERPPSNGDTLMLLEYPLSWVKRVPTGDIYKENGSHE